MARLAVVDLLFHWPPDGGAKIDLVEVLSRLVKFYDVHLVVPSYRRFYIRGEVDADFPFYIHKVPFKEGEYNAHDAPQLIRDIVDQLSPDLVWIADGDALKPYFAQALLDYPLVFRFYSYENLCLKSCGVRYRNNKICIDRSTLTTPISCATCGFYDAVRRRDYFHLEALWGAKAFLPSYKRTLLKCLGRAKATIVSNRMLANELKAVASNIQVIPGGVNAQRFATSYFRQDNIKSSNDVITIGMVGRVDDPLKGFETLKAAVQKALDKDINVKLLVTSNRTFPDHPFIEPVGWVHPEDVLQLYDRMDICVVPSLWNEPFGLVALEAMAASKPLIVTNRGGLADIVQNNINGLKVTAGSVTELTAAIEYLANSPAARKKLGDAARQTVDKFYDWDCVIVQHYIPLITKIIS